jgi:hypothetical protein
MTQRHPRIRQGARAALATLALSTLALLSACGGDDEGPGHAPQAEASGTDNVQAALGTPPEGKAVATSADAVAPAEASAPTVIATDTNATPEATDNDAAAPSEPAPSAV